MNQEQLDSKLAALSAPRVTREMVEAAIIGETYTLLPNGRTTVCQLTLYNNFTVEGQSACVDAANYDPDIGNHYAREKALDKVWAVLGFRLADHLCRPALTAADAAADLAGTARPDYVNPVPEILRWPR